MKKTYRKNILREVKGTRNRFLAIFAIVMLGVSVLTGLLETAPDMRRSADHYFDESHLMDFRVLSTLGLTEEDVAAVRAVEGIEGAMAVKSADVVVQNEAGDSYGARAESLPAGASENDADWLNRLTLLEGRLPEKKGECAALSIGLAAPVAVGDAVTLPAAENEGVEKTLAVAELTVVGLVSAPTNFSLDSESITAGDGKMDLILYLPADSFCGDIYTTLYLTVKGARELESYSDGYEPALQPVKDALETLGEERAELRRLQVIDDARQELADAKTEYEEKKADAEAQLAEAEAQLDDAKAKLEASEAQLEAGEAEWESGTRRLKEEKRKLSATLTDTQRQLADARRQLASGKRQLTQAKRQLEAAQKQYDQALEAQKQVEEGKAQLAQAQRQVQLAEQGIAAAEKALPGLEAGVKTARAAADSAAQRAREAETAQDEVNARPDVQQGLARKAELDAALAAYPEYATMEELLQNPPAGLPEDQLAALQDAYLRYTAAREEAEAAEADAQTARARADIAQAAADRAAELYDSAKKMLEEGKTSLADDKALLEEKQKQLQEAEQQLKASAGMIETAPAQIKAAQKAIDENEQTLQDAELQIQEGELALSLAPTQAQLEFDDAQQQLDDARAQLDDGWSQLEEGRAQYRQGEDEYHGQKEKAEKQLQEAEDQLIDAQRQIDDVNSCEWYVLGRDTLASFVTFEGNADKLAAIAKIFPVFFFLVAALVALTTMTRMVEENRTQIGTLKALGYSEGAITAKYLLYALAASFLGSVVGVVVGFVLFPLIIWNAYSIMYTLPAFELNFNMSLTLVAAAAATLCTAAATVNACHSTLAEKPAALMVAKAPQAGKRIFLERVAPLWKRMKFSYKVTARNLFRYKKRLFMTIVGIAGCTALLLVGFGLQDSIMDLVNTQYDSLWHYDLEISLSSADALEGRRGVEPILSDGERVNASLSLYQKTLDLYNEKGEKQSVAVAVPQETARLAQFVTLQSRRSGRAVEFAEDSAVLTEKAAEMLGVKTGDVVQVDTGEGRMSVALTGITENYLGSCLYIAPELWQKEKGSLPEWNHIFAQTLCENAAGRSALAQDLLAADDVQAAAFTEDTARVFNDTISSINFVVVVVILCAGLLAFIVLYNLININIGERKKELATIKVLGFYEREVSRYIFREIDVLAVLGALAGLALGVPLHSFIIRTVEIDTLMFIRTVDFTSYLYSFALTMAFTVLVSLVMRRTIRKISMVESMKAPE